MRLTLLLAASLAVAPAGGPDVVESFEETELRAAEHLRFGELCESADLYDRAFYHYERVIDLCRDANEEARVRARARRKDVASLVPPNTDEKKANVWRILAVVCRNYAWRSGDGAKPVTYRHGDEPLRQVKAAAEGLTRAVGEWSRGHMRLDIKVIPADDPVRSLADDDGLRWMNPEEFERNFPRIKIRDGEYDQVFAYVVGDGRGSIPLAGPTRWGGVWRFARFWGIAVEPEELKGDGALEAVPFLRSVRNALERRAGYPGRAVPEPDRDDRPEGCCRDLQGPAWLTHLGSDHITTRMWLEVGVGPIAAPTATSRMLLSPRQPNNDDKGLEQAHLNESNPDLDTKGWVVTGGKDDVFDLNQHFGGGRGNTRATAYLATYVYVKRPTWARLLWGCTDQFKAFVNGEEIGRNTDRRDTAVPDDFCFRFLLREGRNLVLVKTASNRDPWSIVLRLTDARGQALRGDVLPVKK